jgi:hypothetical protein
MVILEWYDGPVSGLLVCDKCVSVYYFVMIDWDQRQHMRVFSLAGAPAETLDNILRFFGELPTWPVWFPSALKSPTDDFHARFAPIFEGLRNRNPPSLVIAWDSAKKQCLAIRGLTTADAADAVDWFLLDDPHPRRDWFSFLGLQRLS